MHRDSIIVVVVGDPVSDCPAVRCLGVRRTDRPGSTFELLDDLRKLDLILSGATRDAAGSPSIRRSFVASIEAVLQDEGPEIVVVCGAPTLRSPERWRPRNCECPWCARGSRDSKLRPAHPRGGQLRPDRSFVPPGCLRRPRCRDGSSRKKEFIRACTWSAISWWTRHGSTGSAHRLVHARGALAPACAHDLATVHRAENTDDVDGLRGIFQRLAALDKPVILPLHPGAEKRALELEIEVVESVRVLPPQVYLDMLALERSAACILTDSGGRQKGAYYLKVPCVTFGNETEWMETVVTGRNVLAGKEPDRIPAAVAERVPSDTPHPGLYVEGMTAERIVEILSASGPTPDRASAPTRS
jgi:UDP-N-acetylglucosamine 2-epimerase